MIFMGVLFRKEDEKSILELSNVGVSNAANKFQWNVIDGIYENTNEGLTIVNALPIGTWPKSYNKLLLNNKIWEHMDTKCYEIGGINLPFVKQLTRSIKAKRILKKLTRTDTEVILYSAYMPFLKAAYKLPESVKVTAIITDLPEYYDLQKCSGFRKFLRSTQNKLVYKYMKRVDRFVLLTEKMREPLNVGNRPYTVVEGICGDSENHRIEKYAAEKKIIFYSGTLNYQYGIKNLLDAFVSLNVLNTELWICGTGEAEIEIKAMSERDPRVKFFGFLPTSEVKKLRSHASVLVNPRTNDGEYTKYSFPSKTMEYMASGIPVVMYKLDGIPDEYDDHLLYVNDNTAASLSQTLSDALNMPENEQIAFGEKAKEFVLKYKNKKTQSMKIINLIEVENAYQTQKQ